MKFNDAKEFIKNGSGFRIEFERQEGGMLVSDHFPEDDEETIKTEGEAWEYARKFAKAGKDKGIVNVYVISGSDYTPVEGYKEKELNIYPQKVSWVSKQGGKDNGNYKGIPREASH